MQVGKYHNRIHDSRLVLERIHLEEMPENLILKEDRYAFRLLSSGQQYIRFTNIKVDITALFFGLPRLGDVFSAFCVISNKIVIECNMSKVG